MLKCAEKRQEQQIAMLLKIAFEFWTQMILSFAVYIPFKNNF